MLPRLTEGHGVQTPETTAFTNRPQALHYISRGIDAKQSGERAHSIPDVFSKPIQFEFDLGAKNEESIGAWQGILAALLLCDTSHSRVRVTNLASLPDSPFAQIMRELGAMRGIDHITSFELLRPDDTHSAIAFRFEGMATMFCPAAEIRGPFVAELPQLIQAGKGYKFVAPTYLTNPYYRGQAIALRNELYALCRRSIPAMENKEGLQLSLLTGFFQMLDDVGDDISDYPVNERMRDELFTQEGAAAAEYSETFTDRLCLIRVDSGNFANVKHARMMVISNGSEGSKWSAFIPLKRWFARDNADRLRDGSLSVSMRWRYGTIEAALNGKHGEQIDFKRYRVQDILNLTNTRPAPLIAIWPPKSLKGWQRYYLSQNATSETLPLVALSPDAPESQGAVSVLPKMPSVISFTLFNEDVGLIMPSFEEATNTKTREYQVGFDFGTTGTTAIKFDTNSRVTTPISFTGEGALVVFGMTENAEETLAANFISKDIHGGATHYSLLRRKTDSLSEGRAIIQSTIPFINGARFDAELIRDVYDDLKWGALGNDKLRAHLFLEQHLMMCLWHLATHGASYIHWRASFPLSMQGRHQDDFIAKMQAIIGGLCANCYKIAHDTLFCSESEAVGFMMMDNDIQAQYLSGLTINDSTGFMCVDIGGGTTDMSLWMGRRLVVQSSLRWAGNAILSDSVSRENHPHPPRINLIDAMLPHFEGHRKLLVSALDGERAAEFRRVWNVFAGDIADSVKCLQRTDEPLMNFMNIIRFNLYMMFYYAGRMAREATRHNNSANGEKESMNAEPMYVAVLGNGAKMLNMLCDDADMPSSGGGTIGESRRNESLYAREKDRLARAFKVGLAPKEAEVVIIEPFLPKQEAARGLALAPEAYLLQREAITQNDVPWPSRCAYKTSPDGVVYQMMEDGFKTLIEESFLALRDAFGNDDDLREFLASLFDPPFGADKYSLEAYYRSVWMQSMRHNPEPTLPGQPLPQKNTNSGRFIEILAAMNRFMRTA